MARHYLPSLKDTRSVKPMGKGLSEIFLKVAIHELHTPFCEWTLADATEMGPFGKLLWHRMAIFGNGKPATVSVGVACVVLAQTQVPGDVVLWAFTLNRMFKQGVGPLTLQELAEAFPEGFPDERGKEEIWDAQKDRHWGEDVSGENLLDYPHLLSDTEDFIERKEWCKWLVAT